MTALEVRDLAKHFGGLPAVDGISFDVVPGSITGLIGPNGAGKTTVVNMISGLLKVTGGTISLDGREVTHADAATLARAGVARTFQNIRLITDETVLANVMAGYHAQETTGLAANLLGLPAAFRERARFRRKAYALLERFGMTQLAQHPAGSLSYGHQRKVEMMRALAMRPRVLLLDEPVAGMNDAEAMSLGHIFEAIAEEGVAILLIEHNMRFVMSLCKRIYVLASGQLIAEGDPASVRSDARVIEAYLGS